MLTLIQVSPLVVMGQHKGIIVMPSRLASNVTAPGNAEMKQRNEYNVFNKLLRCNAYCSDNTPAETLYAMMSGGLNIFTVPVSMLCAHKLLDFYDNVNLLLNKKL